MKKRNKPIRLTTLLIITQVITLAVTVISAVTSSTKRKVM
jgi:hypothetical protein